MYLILNGCAGTSVMETREIAESGLPKPRQVLVYNFSVTPDEVKANSAFFSRFKRNIQHADQTAEEIQIGREVADALADELMLKIQALGLNAVRADPATPLTPGSILVNGHFVTINEGNSLQRMAIGFGLGQSSLDAHVTVLAPRPTGYEELIGFDAHSDSGEMPGAAVMGPAGAAAGTGTAAVVATNAALGAAKHYRSSSAREAAKMADSVVKELSKYFARQGWISPDLAQ
ncbi:MAG: DUF4410 domain-containing protein [Methylococcales bacterium]